MGYTTTFNGVLEIVGAEDLVAPEEFVEDLNDFLKQDHRHENEEYKKFNIHTRWCDWRVYWNYGEHPYIAWNGNEKSYDMEKWLLFIEEKYLKPNGLFLEGEVDCFGEAAGDIWKIIADENGIRFKKAKLVFED